MKITKEIERLYLNFKGFDFKTWKSWTKASREYRQKVPYCEICKDRTPKKLETHHVIPQHVCREMNRLDLIVDERNFINTCGRSQCHLQMCHKGNYKNYRPSIRKIADFIDEMDRVDEVIKNG